MQLRHDVGEPVLINARDNSPIVSELTLLGLDLNEGMVVKIDQQIYHGADAVNILALLSSRSSLFNKVNYFCFRSPTISRVLYPALKAGRALALWLMGRKKIS